MTRGLLDNGTKMADYRINPDYANAQLAKALATATHDADATTRERARATIARWRQVLAGLADGSIKVGSRTPVDAPAWATLDVATGGFATGTLLAGGPLREHEVALAQALGVAPDGDRSALNRHFLTEAGLADLAERVRTGCYDVDLPEEAALPTVAWLVEHGHADAARQLVERISPWFARLRFYPIPRDTPRLAGTRVFVQNARTTAEILDGVAPNAKILAQKEAVEIWAPLYDRVVTLMLEVVDDALPRRAFDAAWIARATLLLREFEQLRRVHRLTSKVDDPTTSQAQLRAVLARCAEAPATLTDGHVAQARGIVAGYLRKRGRPDSPQCTALRERQRAEVAAPLYASIAAVVAARVKRCAPDEGVDDVTPLLVPIDSREATGHVAGGTTLPRSIRRKVERCLADTAAVLVERGLIASSEALAVVLPQLTSNVRALRLADATLRDLYATTYRAFRRRRSLLLLNLAKQVRIEELPWVAAIDRFRRGKADATAVARATLDEVATLALTAFPYSIVPSKLLTEFGALAQSAGVDLPLTEEVAADIFMGRFSPKFAASARIAVDALEGSLYAAYYGIDRRAVLRATEPPPETRRERLSSHEPDAFAQLCAARADVTPGSRKPATNGMIIEQQQILTTHNLATLFLRLDLSTTLGERLDAMAQDCFRYLCVRLQLKIDDAHARLVTVKNCAYAWRQMLFFASQLPAARQDALLRWVHDHAAEQSPAFRARFAPALKGLAWVAGGGSLDDHGARAAGAVRWLGWSAGGHWLAHDEAPRRGA